MSIIAIIGTTVVDLAIIAAACFASHETGNWKWMFLCLLVLVTGYTVRSVKK